MPAILQTLHGVVHGKTIELDEAPSLPDGEPVVLTLHPVNEMKAALLKAFGSCADEAEDLDAYLEEVRKQRKGSRYENLE